uniref:NADH-ubiquinone oxidoreductase chain 4L n=1 Tax=Uroplatus ebenaui TaxID=357318 RepID=A0A0A1HAM6_9SAUR|nr:NADH dehydrogenase subunit 4L [Uroplatus ebenaui]BAP90317.1 NADH dehydrogenase subunit 4L [Uroplatus ebenaui]
MAPTPLTMIMLYLLGILGVALYRKHLISSLMCIESITLTLFLMLILTAHQAQMTSAVFYPIILLALAACGASVGLALLVVSVRSHATDHIKSLSLLKC